MKRRFTEEQIIGILKAHEKGGTVMEICRKNGICEQTFYRWNQVWGVDITYIHMHKGFMYLFVIIDWYSRYIVDYELSQRLSKLY
jgi:transposase InsO family protein